MAKREPPAPSGLEKAEMQQIAAPDAAAHASAPSSSTACRTCCAVAVDGTGAPNVIVTRYGTARRPFPEEAPVLETEDAAPHLVEATPESPARRARRPMRSKPLEKRQQFPVRLIAPSAHEDAHDVAPVAARRVRFHRTPTPRCYRRPGSVQRAHQPVESPRLWSTS